MKRNAKEFINEYITKLGFSDEDADIYHALLSKGQLTILEMSRVTGIERTKLYSLTEELLKKGLINETRNYKKRYFSACTIKELELLRGNELNRSKFLESSFPMLSSYIEHFQNHANPTKVVHYHGVNGLKQMQWNILDAKNTVFSILYRSFFEVVSQSFSERWNRRCVELKIPLREIRTIEYLRTRIPVAVKHDHTWDFKDYEKRFIDPKIFSPTCAIELYNDVVSIYNWRKGEIYGVELYNKQVAHSFRQIFDVFWNMAEKWDYEKLLVTYKKHLK